VASITILSIRFVDKTNQLSKNLYLSRLKHRKTPKFNQKGHKRSIYLKMRRTATGNLWKKEIRRILTVKIAVKSFYSWFEHKREKLRCLRNFVIMAWNYSLNNHKKICKIFYHFWFGNFGFEINIRHNKKKLYDIKQESIPGNWHLP
jgi:hypothetical protein